MPGRTPDRVQRIGDEPGTETGGRNLRVKNIIQSSARPTVPDIPGHFHRKKRTDPISGRDRRLPTPETEYLAENKIMEKNRYKPNDHTFVICAYRESPYLEECIHSLLGQTVKSRVLMATSTPNGHIRRLADQYHIPLRLHPGGKGMGGDWNFALSCAGSPLATLAHQDDRYGRHYTEQILRAANQCDWPLLIFTDYCELRNGALVRDNRLLRVKRLLLSPLRLKRLWKNRFVRRRILSLGSAICCPTVTIVKEHVPEPVFQSHLKNNLDWEAWEKISRLEGEFAYIAKPLAAHRIHADSATSSLIQENGRRAEDLYMFQKFWPGAAAELIERFYQKSERSNRQA